ncbi:MAG: hypothetical protein MHMPM18_003269 [Marteilia pararefringens]
MALKAKKKVLNKDYANIMQHKKDNEDSSKMIIESFSTIKDNLNAFVRAPNSSKIIQYMIEKQKGDSEFISTIFDTLESDLKNIISDKHGVFVIEKLYEYLDEGRKSIVFGIIMENIHYFSSQKCGSKLIDSIFKQLPKEKKEQFLGHFFGPLYVHEIGMGVAKDKIFSDAEKKFKIACFLKKHLKRMMKEKIVKSTFSLKLLSTFFEIAREDQFGRLYELIYPHIWDILVNNDGATVALKCINKMEEDAQKALLESVPVNLIELLCNKNSYLIICSLFLMEGFDSVLKDSLSSIVNNSMDIFFTDKYASRFLLFVLSGDSTEHLPSDMIEVVTKYENLFSNTTSRANFITEIKKSLYQHLIANIENILVDVVMQKIILSVLPLGNEYQKSLLDSLFAFISPKFQLLTFFDSNMNHHFLKKLLKINCTLNHGLDTQTTSSIADLFVNNLKEINVTNIYPTNRGCFTLVCAYEQCSEPSKVLMKQIFKPYKNEILKNKESAGSKLLSDKLF